MHKQLQLNEGNEKMQKWRVLGIDPRASSILYRSPLGQKLSVQFEEVASVGERVMVKT